MAKPMQLRIVCPEECVYEGAVAYVAVPSTVGEFGILPHHASEICTIDGGHIRVSETKMGVVDHVFAVTGGYVQVAITVAPGASFMEVTHVYPDMSIHLTLLNARITAGEPQLLEHEALRWITPAEIPEYEFCPADEAILTRLRGAAE